MSDELAVGAAAPLQIRAKVIQVQDWIRRFVGEGVRVNWEWSRTGLQTFNLMGQRPTKEEIFGRSGEFRASAPQSHLMIDEPSLAYRVRGKDIIYDFHFVHVGGAEELPGDAVGASDPNQAVGSIGLMGVVSILSFVWQLLHPELTLSVPGEVGCQLMLTGETLSIDILRPLPEVHFRIVLAINAGISRITLQPDLLHVDLSGGPRRFIERRLV